MRNNHVTLLDHTVILRPPFTADEMFSAQHYSFEC